MCVCVWKDQNFNGLVDVKTLNTGLDPFPSISQNVLMRKKEEKEPYCS